MKRRCEGVVIRVREDIVNPPVLVKVKSDTLRILILPPEVPFFVVRKQSLLPKVPIFETKKMELLVAKLKFKTTFINFLVII